MEFGWHQIMGYAVETTYGVARSPSSAVGIVTSGEAVEGVKLYGMFGNESMVRVSEQLSGVACRGSATMLFQNPVFAAQAFTRSAPMSYLPSLTFDVGASIAVPPSDRIWPRRFVGSKIDRLSIVIRPEEPVYMSVDWYSQRTETGDWPSYSPAATPIYAGYQVTSVRGSDPITDFDSIEISVNNNLQPVYMVSCDNPYPRSPALIREGPQQIGARIVEAGRRDSTVRYLQASANSADFTLQIALADMCGSNDLTLTLSHCFQESLSEPLAPNQQIAYSYDISARGIAIS